LIGVIGPLDSVDLVIQTAAELELGDLLLTRVYEEPAEAVDLALELDDACGVLLFTGWVPYRLALRSDSLRARLQHIPHDGTDLFRTLAALLMKSPTVPRFSVDSMLEAGVQEALEDLDISATVATTLSFDVDNPASLTNELASRHADLHARGEVDVCLTCLDAVYRELRRRSVPAVRIRHARSVVRTALTTAASDAELERAVSTQLAVVAVETSGPEPHVHALAKEVGGQLVRWHNPSTAILHTTRGAAVRWLETQSARPDPSVDQPRDAIGIGSGSSPAEAETQARRALTLARREGVPYLVASDGYATPASNVAPSFSSRGAPRPGTGTQLSYITMQRLHRSLRQIGSDGVTAASLAAAHGVAPRSARRILRRLVDNGVATLAGEEHSAGAGRPQAVYRIDLDALLRQDL
jgi:hypothetical protein